MEIIEVLTQSRKIFFDCVDIYNENYRKNLSLHYYRDIIADHRKVKDLNTLLKSDYFLSKIRPTLEKWDMNQRGARLEDSSTICSSILSHQEQLISLYHCRLEDLTESEAGTVITKLNELFCGLKIMATQRRIIGISKVLHFLLPDLVMPIDSSNTMIAFYGYNKYNNIAEKEFKAFADIFDKSSRIAKQLELSQSDVTGLQWSTSVPKLIDNAIFGFFMKLKAK